MRRPLLATLALSLLALLFGWETREALLETPGRQENAATAPAGTWRPGVSAPDPQPPPDPNPSAAAVAARPLFRPDRQPFREQGPGASARNYEEELSRYALLGVLDFGDAPFGVVVGKAGSKGERWEVRKGDLLQGFTVKEVGMEGLRLTAEGREFLLPLYAGPPTAGGGSFRAETPRRDAAQSPSAPGSQAPQRAGAPPRPGPPGTVPGSANPLQPRVLPGVAQRYVPGRR